MTSCLITLHRWYDNVFFILPAHYVAMFLSIKPVGRLLKNNLLWLMLIEKIHFVLKVSRERLCLCLWDWSQQFPILSSLILLLCQWLFGYTKNSVLFKIVYSVFMYQVVYYSDIECFFNLVCLNEIVMDIS